VDSQLALLEAVKGMIGVPMVIAVNKADVKGMEGFLNMSTLTGEGVDAVLEALLRVKEPSPMRRQGRTL
jgi:GTP1/Obg family GTP-binding protein